MIIEKTKNFNKRYFEKYEKHFNILKERALTAKEFIFLDFFGKNFRENLKEINENNENYNVFISGMSLDITQYDQMLENYFYPVFLGNIAQSIAVLEKMRVEFKDKVKDANIDSSGNIRYHLSKNIDQYFKIEVVPYGVSYDLTKSGEITNIQYVNYKKYTAHEILGSFFSITKNGEWVPDEALLNNNIISKEEYLERLAKKFIFYRQMVIDNSIRPDLKAEETDWFPDALVIGLHTKVNLETMQTENFWKQISDQKQIFDAISSYNFHVIAKEPLSIDSVLALDIMR